MRTFALATALALLSVTSAAHADGNDGRPAPVVVLTPPSAPVSKPLPVRAIVGWSAIVGGAALIATGVGFTVAHSGDEGDLNSARQDNYGTASRVAITDPCNPPVQNSRTQAGCNASNAESSATVGAITTFSIGGALAVLGVVLLVTDHPARSTPPPAPTGLGSIRLLPSAAIGGGSLLVLGQF